MAQIVYQSDEQTITFTMAKQADVDLLGDVSEFTEQFESTCKGFSVPLYGKGGVAYAAQWSENDKTFACALKWGLRRSFLTRSSKACDDAAPRGYSRAQRVKTSPFSLWKENIKEGAFWKFRKAPSWHFWIGKEKMEKWDWEVALCRRGIA